MAVNQVMAANFYGNRGRAIGAGQAAYFNDPGIGGDEPQRRAKGAGEKRAARDARRTLLEKRRLDVLFSSLKKKKTQSVLPVRDW